MIITWFFILFIGIKYFFDLDVSLVSLFIMASVSFWIFQKLAWILLKIEIGLGIVTQFTFGEKKGLSSHMQGVFIFEGLLECEEFKKKISENIFKRQAYLKLKTRLHSNFFFHYYKEDKTFNLENHIEIIKKPFNNYEELYEFVAKHQGEIKFSDLHPKWKFFLFERLGENESAMLFKVHHQYGDAMSFVSFILDIMEPKEYKIIKLPPISNVQWIIALLITIVKVPWIVFRHLILTKPAICGFHKATGLTNIKKVYSLNNISVNDLKLSGKSSGLKINDIIVTCLIRTLSLYCKKHYNEKIQKILMVVPKSFRNIPEKGEHIPIGFVVMPFVVDFPLIEWRGFEATTKYYSKFLAKYKYTFENFINAWALEFLCMVLPEFIGRRIVQFITAKVNCLFSNVPGPLEQIEFFGKKVKTMIPFFNMHDDVEVIFACFSYNGKLVLSCVSDTSVDFSPKDFVFEFKRVLDEEFLGQLEDKGFKKIN